MLPCFHSKGAEHQNICRKMLTMKVKGAEHRNIFKISIFFEFN